MLLVWLIGCGGGGGGDKSGGGNVIDQTALTQQVFDAINQQRQNDGLGALTRNATLDQLASTFARQIAEAQQTSFDGNHTGPDGKTAAQRMQASGYNPSVWGENIGWSSGSDVQTIITTWMNSPSHRTNILKAEFKETGIGVVYNPAGGQVKYWWVQEFGAR